MKMTCQHWLGRSLAIALLLSSGQSAIAAPLPTPSHPAPFPSANTLTMLDTLELVTWQLVSYQAADGTTMDAFGEQPATFQFQAGQIVGTTGCNRFFNSYSREGDRLTISSGGSTLMACHPTALADQEAAILSGLPQVTSYTQIGDQLQLLDSAGNPLFTLTPQPTADLTNTEWTLTVYNNGQGGLTTPVIDTTITAHFDPEKGLSGSAGCNNYRANYQLNNNAITVGPASSTRRLCSEPEGVMLQESAYLALLQDVATYSISGNQLDLKNATGTTLARFTTNL